MHYSKTKQISSYLTAFAANKVSPVGSHEETLTLAVLLQCQKNSDDSHQQTQAAAASPHLLQAQSYQDWIPHLEQPHIQQKTAVQSGFSNSSSTFCHGFSEYNVTATICSTSSRG